MTILILWQHVLCATHSMACATFDMYEYIRYIDAANRLSCHRHELLVNIARAKSKTHTHKQTECVVYKMFLQLEL